MTNLPVGWKRATLGELGVEARPGFASGKHNSEGDGVVHLRPMNVTREGQIDLGDVRYVQDATDRRVHAGDVLFNNTNSPALVGKTALVTSQTPLGYSNHMTRLRPPQELRSDFLAHQVHWLWMKGYFQTVLNNHVNQASVASKRLLETPIDVPPFAEQQRIVIDLERYFARLRDGLSGLRRASALLSLWREATLVRAFRGKLVEEDLSEGDARDLRGRFTAAAVEGPWALPNQWIWRRLGDLFTVSIGATPSRSDASLWGGGIPWVSSGEVAFNHIDHTRETISIAALPDPGSRIHPPGTVMLAMIGEGKTRGQAAILDISAAHNQNCASIRVSETLILPEYIYWFLQLRYNENRQAASGGNQPALNKRKVENILVPLAPLGTQRKIVSILESVDLQIVRTADTVQGATKHAQNLKKKIYNAAFSGLLGSNGSEP